MVEVQWKLQDQPTQWLTQGAHRIATTEARNSTSCTMLGSQPGSLRGFTPGLYLVQGVADVEVAVCVWGAVM